MRKALLLFCFIFLVGSVAPSGADDSASPNRRTPAWKNLSRGNTLGGVISNALTFEASPSPKDKEKLKVMEREILAARIIEQAMKFVRSEIQFGYDTFVLVDPEQDFPGVTSKRLAEMKARVAFSLGDQFPIYVNVPMLLEKLEGRYSEEFKLGSYRRAGAVFSTTIAHELTHPYGADELEALRVEEKQLDLIAAQKILHPEDVKSLRADIRAEMRLEERAVAVSLNRP